MGPLLSTTYTGDNTAITYIHASTIDKQTRLQTPVAKPRVSLPDRKKEN